MVSEAAQQIPCCKPALALTLRCTSGVSRQGSSKCVSMVLCSRLLSGLAEPGGDICF